MNFLKIAWQDISSIFKNKFIRISVTAIIVVPLLYSLLYLAAFWDPYNRLSDLPVAVVNMDKGSMKDGESVNYGKDVADKLRENNKIGWRFVSYEDAKKGVEGKDYYAMFVIPEDFSAKVMSAKDGAPKQPEILYTANEKRNFLAAQINGKVLVELKAEITKNISKVYTKVAFDKLHEIKDGMNKAADGSSELADGINTLKDKVPEMKDGVGKLYDGSNQLKEGIGQLKDNVPTLVEGVSKLYEGSSTMTSGIGELKGKTDEITKLIAQNPQIKALLSPSTIQKVNKLAKDGAYIASLDTSVLDNINPNTVNAISKTMVDVNSLVNSKELKEMVSTPSIQLVISQMDFSKPENAAALKERVDNLNALMSDVQLLRGTISKVDSNKLNNMLMPLKDLAVLAKQNPVAFAAKVNDLHNTLAGAAALAKDKQTIDSMNLLLNNMDNVKALLGTATNSMAKINISDKDKAELAALSDKDLAAISANKDAMVSAITNLTAKGMLSQEQARPMIAAIKIGADMSPALKDLMNVQQALNNPSTKVLMSSLQGLDSNKLKASAAMLSQLQANGSFIEEMANNITLDNVKALMPLMEVTQNLDKLKGDLAKNEENLKLLDEIMQKSQDGSLQKLMPLVSKVKTDMDSSKPLIDSLMKDPTLPQKLANSSELLAKLKAMQGDVKDSSDLIAMAQRALNEGNIEKAQGFINAIPKLTEGVNSLYDGSKQINSGLAQLNEKVPALAAGTNKLYDGSSQLQQGLKQLNDNMPELQDGAQKLADGSKELKDKLSEGASELNKNLVNDSETMSKFVSEPVTMNEKPVYSVKDYGTGFTPYFIPLSLWVGALMMFFVITDKVDENINASPASVVIGKFLSYGYIGILQAVLASVVVLFLGLKPANVPLYILFNIFMSFVFIAIIQSLIFLLGEVGRLLSIVLLILQLTSCAGTFPLEVVPTFFKVLNPFMPFTYCVSGLRELISGVDYGVLAHDTAVLAGVMITFLVVSVLMKERADKLQKKIRERKESVVA